MTDDVGRRLVGVDAPRPIPPGLRARLESVLSVSGDDVDELSSAFDGSDEPRPLPADLRARLEASLLTGDTMPQRVRRRVERALALPVPTRRVRVLAAAAVLALVVASVTTAVRLGSGGDDVAGSPGADVLTDGGTGAEGTSGSGVGGEALDGDSAVGDGAGESLSPLPDGADDVTGGEAGGGAGGGPAEPTAGSGSAGDSGAGAPPFAFGEPPSAGRTYGDAQPEDAAPGIRIGVVEGDDDVGAAFRAYVDLLNESGGIRGRPVELVVVSQNRPDAATIATANLAREPLADAAGAPPWVQAPLLEAVEAPEVVLRGDVFSFTSVLERQAHLAAFEAFPEPAPGATAAIYHAQSGPYGTRVPAALEEALRARGVTPVRTVVASGSATPVRADAAFVSLPAEDTRAFLRSTRAQRTPERGLWGIASLFDESILGELPSGTHVLSPYTVPASAEAAALREGSGRPLGTSTVHGWVTAKMLSVALWQTGAQTPEELTAAIERLTGYENGFMPAFEMRPGTRSRTPEGVVLVPGDQYKPVSPFRRDPF